MSKKVKRPKTLPQHLKHWFVPHKHNDHRPHLIRMHGLAAMALLIVCVQVAANLALPASVKAAQPAGPRVLAYASNITPVDLLSLTNQQRVANGLPPLVMDSRLNHSAALKAANMFAENYWAHVSPSGIQPWYWFTQAGYNYTAAGENLAMDFDTSAGTLQGWMNSPGHRANILNPAYKDVGFAVQNGTLTGEQTTLVVAHYGATAAPAVAAAPRPVATARPVPATPAPATPAPVPTPEPATPSPTPTATSHPVVPAGSIANPAAPAPQQYSLFKPLSLIRTLNIGSLVTLGLLLMLFIVYVFTHITVWRKGLGRWKNAHYRLLAAAQLSGLGAAIILLAVSGFGRVG